jgi:hypothetical protein
MRLKEIVKSQVCKIYLRGHSLTEWRCYLPSSNPGLCALVFLSAAPFEAFDTTSQQATSQALAAILNELFALQAEVLVVMHEEPHHATTVVQAISTVICCF